MITLEHVAITTTRENFAQTKTFYENVFGMTQVREGKDIAFITDGQGGRIELQSYGQPPLAHPNHLAFGVPLESFDATVDKLRAAGVPVDEPSLNVLGDRLCYFSDPAGNRGQIVGRHNPLPK